MCVSRWESVLPVVFLRCTVTKLSPLFQVREKADDLNPIITAVFLEVSSNGFCISKVLCINLLHP